MHQNAQVCRNLTFFFFYLLPFTRFPCREPKHVLFLHMAAKHPWTALAMTSWNPSTYQSIQYSVIPRLLVPHHNPQSKLPHASYRVSTCRCAYASLSNLRVQNWWRCRRSESTDLLTGVCLLSGSLLSHPQTRTNWQNRGINCGAMGRGRPWSRFVRMLFCPSFRESTENARVTGWSLLT